MTRVWVRELMGWLAASALALIVSGQMAASARSELLFRDGDSLIVALFAQSSSSGGPSHWALSSVLFLPETAVFTGLDLLLPFDVNGVLAASAVVNLLMFYGALRLVAGRRRSGTSPVTWALIATAVFGLLAVTETSASRDALELASLLLTTTYYSTTVIAVVLSVGLIRRFVAHEKRGAGLLVPLASVAALATLSNPLFAVWATIPLIVVLAVLALRPASRSRMLLSLAVLVGGTAIGFLGRIPFSEWIANTGAGYAQPELWVQSVGYYSHLLGDRLTTPLGVIGTLLTVALLVFAAIRSIRVHEPAERVVALAAWVIPVLVVLGAIALGTHAARYLQPLAFAPVLALVAAPRALSIPRLRPVFAAIAVMLLAGSVVSIPRLASAAQAPDADLTCVTGWVDASGRTGAGQFWTVRLPKLHLDDPARLVQVDHQLNGYAWLVNRTDFDVGEVSFLIEDAQTVAWQLPLDVVPDGVVDCGRYRILDFANTPLPLGPQHS
ncbi:hypothetical protein [Microbacterium saperdae]|uniref:4-amino-4-deoxy-L-arabinose transferase-like glycosyltransferase n=1 Tax=Microbacterium saperdae TaxID=69368 RepID=A0A543BB15_9MICO|nr:hypothetical protein [Microbacterium saperdae]TQL81933.1 hypothetical protein FB560_3414 [Microbacterium saperdae]GGM35854.1 hypothetical protein GCM10010489_03490 [Microbacterium saperdae]